ncbi:AzlC family ABC transporter permease [Moraxella ovis]|uniref:AzlC family ABC transporter permease n=1 Tax=Moraxella ovis TaxID=29433 RepID=UPI000D8F4971|nr:AzlC family ABC transporter permease [Moraxella ovis]SPX84459.1 azaleucine resistance protein AzlC [Moraxella ovis]STZ07025.1 azaleucine resistance protein AzlC [Moraxella ovis]
MQHLKPTIKSAFIQSLPILSGFLFLGMAYGVYMRSLGFGAIYPIAMAFFIFAGSVEFVMASALLAAFNPLSVLLLIGMISARQIFYGISMLHKFKGIAGFKKFYLVSAMTDESFAINYSANIKDGIDKTWFMVFITIFLHIYWVIGAALGALLSDVLPFDLKGSEFAMTALFLVIFMEQWLKEDSHISSIIGLGISIVSLVIFGKDSFLIPAMAGILILLGAFRTRLGAYH